jgi:uncharacterized cofD-like protein
MTAPGGGRSSGDRSSAQRLRRWLRPGLGVKRWLAVVFGGELLVAFAGALVLRQVYRAVAPDDPSQSPLLWLITLQFLPLALRPVVLIAAGALIFLAGLWRLLGTLLEPFDRHEAPLVDLILQRRSLARGPRVVAIGGGTGLSTLLRGLKAHTSNITAVVAVADDGGSSGRLRDELGTVPMGDIRNCIAALADDESTMGRLLQYRFPGPDGKGQAQAPAIAGHALGNLLIAALSDIEGDFEEAVRQANRVLAVRGQVVPAAGISLTLHAELGDGSRLDGQSRIAAARGIRRVWISPEDAHATGDALAAIGAADLVVLGPGSLYTSLLPNLLIPEIRAAVASCRGLRAYVVNVATQPGETEGFGLADHLAALDAHGLGGLIDVALAQDGGGRRRSRGRGRPAAEPVAIDLAPDARPGLELVCRQVVDPLNPRRHDPALLATELLALLDGRRPAAIAAPATIA